MKLLNRLPNLECRSENGKDIIYALQVINCYDNKSIKDGSYYAHVSDNIEELKKYEEKHTLEYDRFCKSNTNIEPHLHTIRYVKFSIDSEVISSTSAHYGNDKKYKPIKCTNCKGNIEYGDEVVVYNKLTFCCAKCVEDYGILDLYTHEDLGYDELFSDERDEQYDQ